MSFRIDKRVGLHHVEKEMEAICTGQTQSHAEVVVLATWPWKTSTRRPSTLALTPNEPK
jgi:hypothetical protein